ncbi:MAG: HAD family hydrolase [Myxococcota bacterium]
MSVHFSPPPKTLAVFRVDGALFDTSMARASSWMLMQQRDWSARLAGTTLAATLPHMLRSLWSDNDIAQRAMWAPLRGCSEDRLELLAEDFARDILAPSLRPVAARFHADALERGDHVVWVTPLPRRLLGELPQEMGAHHVLCNTLEMTHRAATGLLTGPLQTGELDGMWLRTYAQQRGLSTDFSLGYGARATDATLLSAVARPCAIHPDSALRRLAKRLDWPVVLT